MTTRINKDYGPMDVAKKIVVELDSSELATVLAALRSFQRDYEDVDGASIADAWPMHFNVQGEGEELKVIPEPLGTHDIDTLCERINCSPAPKRRRGKSGVEYLAQHPGWKTRSKSLTKIELLAHVFRSHVSILVEYLAEAHEADRKNYVNGRSHGGDGAAGCSYCNAMNAANAALTKHTLQPGT